MSASENGHEAGRSDGNGNRRDAGHEDACAELGDLVSAYADGELAGDDLARVEAHVLACESCRARVEAYREMDSAAGSLADIVAPEVGEAEWGRRKTAVFAAGAGAAAPAIRTTRAGRILRRVAWGIALAAAAAIIVAVLLPGRIGENGSGPGGLEGEKVVAEVLEAEAGEDYGVACQDTGEDGSAAVTFLALGPDE